MARDAKLKTSCRVSASFCQSSASSPFPSAALQWYQSLAASSSSQCWKMQLGLAATHLSHWTCSSLVSGHHPLTSHGPFWQGGP